MFIEGRELWGQIDRRYDTKVHVHCLLEVGTAPLLVLWRGTPSDPPPVIAMDDNGLLGALVHTTSDLIGGGDVCFCEETWVSGILRNRKGMPVVDTITYCRVGSQSTGRETELIGGSGLCLGVGPCTEGPVDVQMATRIAQAYVAVMYRKWLPDKHIRINMDRVREMDGGWVFDFDDERYLEEGQGESIGYRFPVFVARDDGQLHVLPRHDADLESWDAFVVRQSRNRTRIRGQSVERGAWNGSVERRNQRGRESLTELKDDEREGKAN